QGFLGTSGRPQGCTCKHLVSGCRPEHISDAPDKATECRDVGSGDVQGTGGAATVPRWSLGRGGFGQWRWRVARKVVVTVIDDVAGVSAAVETVSFGIDGVGYEIDLSESNARELHAGLGKWIPFARRVGGRDRRTTGVPAGRQRDARAV